MIDLSIDGDKLPILTGSLEKTSGLASLRYAWRPFGIWSLFQRKRAA
jgi:hypothetical protein